MYTLCLIIGYQPIIKSLYELTDIPNLVELTDIDCLVSKIVMCLMKSHYKSYTELRMNTLPSIKPPNSHLGMSLLEALIIITIIAIMSSMTIPAYSSVVEAQQRMTSLHSLHHVTSLARSEAIKRNQHIAICPSMNGHSCLRSKDYSKGWIMFVNTDRDTPVQRDEAEIIVKHGNALKNSRFSLLANRYAFIFRPMGKRNTNGTFILCPILDKDKNSNKYQSVVISYTGRPRIEHQAQKQHIRICQ